MTLFSCDGLSDVFKRRSNLYSFSFGGSGYHFKTNIALAGVMTLKQSAWKSYVVKIGNTNAMTNAWGKTKTKTRNWRIKE